MSFSEILNLLEKVFSNNIVKSVLVIVFAVIFYKVISHLLDARSRKLQKLDRKKSETYVHLVNSIVKYAILVFCFFTLLQVNNVNITSMIAGLGIAGIILGVAVQDALKDIIRGFDIVSDDYFKVGDLIEYKGTEGKVVEIGLKTTKISDIRTGNTVSVPNREIEAIGLVSNDVFIEIPMPYETALKEAEAAAEEICHRVKKNADVAECAYLGVNKLDDSAIKYLIKITCKDNLKKLKIRRDALHIVLETLASKGIAVPYNQLDVHTK